MSSSNKKKPLRDLQFLPHVIVIGGGFGGIATARGLADRGVRVTVIDQHLFASALPGSNRGFGAGGRGLSNSHNFW